MPTTKITQHLQAAASINISRSNSLEDVLSLPSAATAPNGAHSRAPSQDLGHPYTTLPKGIAHSATGGHLLASRATVPQVGKSLPENLAAGAEPEGEPLLGLPLNPPSSTVSGRPAPSPPAESAPKEPPGRPGSADRPNPQPITRFGQEVSGGVMRAGEGLVEPLASLASLPPPSEPLSPVSSRGREKGRGGSTSPRSNLGPPQEVQPFNLFFVG